jgi:hypothetical protein
MLVRVLQVPSASQEREKFHRLVSPLEVWTEPLVG